MNKIILTMFILSAVLLAGCAEDKQITDNANNCPMLTPPSPDFCTDGRIVSQKDENGCNTQPKCVKDDSTQIANPASTFCIENGGTLEIVNEADGQVGICTLSNGIKCEEWAYFRGECSSTTGAGKATKCTDPRPEICTMEYAPVCGYFDENVKCKKYPCAIDYSNGCTACSDSKVAYWEKGECPK